MSKDNGEVEYNEKVNIVLEGLDNGETRESLTEEFGYSHWKSLDTYMRRKGFRYDGENYVPKNNDDNSKSGEVDEDESKTNSAFLTPEHEDMPGYFDHTFDNSILDIENIVVASSGGRNSGELEFMGNYQSSNWREYINWEKGEIIREYPLKVVDGEGKNLEGNDVIYNESKKTTNDDGKAEVKFSFNKSNYIEEREILIEIPDGQEKIIPIHFITDTPIIIGI